MTDTPGLPRDERGATTAAALALGALAPPLAVLVGVVIGTPPLVAVVGALVRRERAARYVLTAATSLVAVFALTGAVGFAAHWGTLGVLAVLAAVGAHVGQFRDDRVDLLVVGGIYATPAGLGVVLLLGTLGVVPLPA